MLTQEEMEDLYGPLAAHREHNPGERISYRLAGEPGDYHGRIVWVCEATREVSMCYVVERDGAGESIPDIVFPAGIIIMTLRFQTKIDWLVRCKMEHAQKETETIYGSRE